MSGPAWAHRSRFGWSFAYPSGRVLTIVFPRGRRLQLHWTRPVRRSS